MIALLLLCLSSLPLDRPIKPYYERRTLISHRMSRLLRLLTPLLEGWQHQRL